MSEFLDNYLENFPNLPKPDLHIRTDGKEEISLRGELAQLDQTIINYVTRRYPSMIIPDMGMFMLEFCNDYPYRASVVTSRVEQLRMRGWK
ncbi:hypothetical protein V7O66_13850 [Methanolobus sp. ZRKC3]|uniref:hypothetical protein n=1 Tax=Methanolobus sp. ZRKC3 TaxID=3125786 RepID=UPI00325540B7